MAAVLIYGIINSATFLLLSIGFNLTFGYGGVANFAYGALFLLGGFICWTLIKLVGLPYILSIILSVFATGLFGFVLYWSLIYRLRGMLLSEVVVTFAGGIAILEFLKWKGLYGYEYSLDPIVEGSREILGVFVDYQRLVILGIALILTLFIHMFTKYTKTGLSFRAIAQNEQSAIAMGIESDHVAALSLCFGSALAAVAAIAVLPLGIIHISQGYDTLIYALAVGILGGLGSTAGIIVASLILGFGQIIVGTYFKPEWMMVVVLFAIISILLVKPSGIFGKHKELEERV
ncbi:MAG: branched-chain amino acid ABC transporter permease [Candidatus Aenigmatarchaeota archaeon]